MVKIEQKLFRQNDHQELQWWYRPDTLKMLPDTKWQVAIAITFKERSVISTDLLIIITCKTFNYDNLLQATSE